MSKTRLSAPEGFSLIELLVVVAVVGILAAVAYPSYQEQLASARRSDMKAELMRLAQYMERLYTETGCYNPDDDNSCTGSGTPDIGTTNDHYSVAFTDGEPTATTFTLEATPKADAPKRNVKRQHRRHEGQRHQGAEQQAEQHDGAEAAVELGAGAGIEHQRRQAGDRGDHGHHDGPQAHAHRVGDGIDDDFHALLAQVATARSTIRMGLLTTVPISTRKPSMVIMSKGC
jgi:type IV pilus assembly protein PilE